MRAWAVGAPNAKPANTIGNLLPILLNVYVNAEQAMHLYREFHLRTPAVWETFVAFVKANARAMADAGTPLRLIVTTSESKRNNEQNKRYWGFVLKTIAEQAWVDGRQFNADVWHEYFARKFGVCDEVTLPGDEVITRRRSTTDMTVSEFTAYMGEIEAHAMSHLGVTFET